MVILIPALLPFPGFSVSDQLFQAGIWVYLLVFLLITFTSTIVGGAVPDNMFLILLGAATVDNGLSLGVLIIVSVCGGFAGYEINYWSGRLLGYTTCKLGCPGVLSDKNVSNAIALMNKFGPVSLVLSRFLPVLNVRSFIAGLNSMNYSRFIVYNLVSAILWCGVLLTLGYFIGDISQIDEYLDVITDIFIVITAIIVIIVVITFIWNYRTGKKSHA